MYDFDGKWHRLAQVTGPTHNFLGLVFTSEPVPGACPLVEVQRKPGENARVSQKVVVQEVLEGVRRANATFGTHVAVSAIQYVASDTPMHGVYERLAYSLVERARGSGHPRDERRSAAG
jgi:hypothetical protein